MRPRAGNPKTRHNALVTLTQVLVAVLLFVVIWRVSVFFLRMLATPPPEPDPDDTEDVLQHFRCSTCGTEVTMTVASNTEVDAPRHCREEMTLVWRPE